MNSGRAKLFKVLFSWGVTAATLTVLLVRTDADKLFPLIAGADPLYLAAALVVSLLNAVVVATRKYSALLGCFGLSISFLESMIIRLGSLPAKIIMPLKSGEFFRVLYLRNKHNMEYKSGVYSIILGYLARIPALLFLAASGLALGSGMPYLAAVLAAAPVLPALFSRKYGGLALYSYLSELCLVLNYVFVFMALGLGIALKSLLVSVPAILLATGLPVSVMGIGLREFAVVHVFSGAAVFEGLLAAGLLVSVLEGVVPLVISGFFVSRFAEGFLGRKAGAETAGSGGSYLERRKKNFFTRYRLEKRTEEIAGVIGRYRPDGNLKVLEVGAADGTLLGELNSRFSFSKAVGVEPSRELRDAKADAAVDLVDAKGENLPFGENEFDIVIIASVLEHVSDAGRVVSECSRVLRKNGLIIVTAVDGFLDKLASTAGVKPDDHERTFAPGEIRGMLEKNCLNVTEARRFGPVFYSITVAEK